MAKRKPKEYVCPWTGQTIIFKEMGGQWHATSKGYWMSKGFKTVAVAKRKFGKLHPSWENGDNRAICPWTGADLEEVYIAGFERWEARGPVWFTTRKFDKARMYQFLAGKNGVYPDLPSVKVVDNTAPLVDVIREEAEERHKAVNDAIEEASEKGLLPDATG